MASASEDRNPGKPVENVVSFQPAVHARNGEIQYVVRARTQGHWILRQPQTLETEPFPRLRRVKRLGSASPSSHFTAFCVRTDINREATSAPMGRRFPPRSASRRIFRNQWYRLRWTRRRWITVIGSLFRHSLSTY